MSQGLVLINGREDTQDQTGQNYEKPVEKNTEHTLVLIKML